MRQDCVLPLAPFNLYADIIFRKIEHLTVVKEGGIIINNICYAHDTILMTEDETQQKY